jgi:hypothetical protein
MTGLLQNLLFGACMLIGRPSFADLAVLTSRSVRFRPRDTRADRVIAGASNGGPA